MERECWFAFVGGWFVEFSLVSSVEVENPPLKLCLPIFLEIFTFFYINIFFLL